MAAETADEPPRQTQRRVIEETVGQMMSSLVAVHGRRSSPRGTIDERTHRRLQKSLLATLDFFRPYRRQAEMAWDDVGPDGWSPDALRGKVRSGQSVVSVPSDGYAPEPRQERQGVLVDIGVLEQMVQDTLELAHQLEFYPAAGSGKRPVEVGAEGLPTSEEDL